MKLLFTFLIVCFSMLSADEVQRIESIVDDISKLRSDYIRVQSDLIEMEVRLEEEKEQSKILHEDLKLYSNYIKKEKDYKNKIISLENEIQNLKKSIEIKEKNKIVCKITAPKVIKTTVIIEKSLNNQSIDEENLFPALVMKEKYQTGEVDTKAYSYRVKTEANIYDSIDGFKISIWDNLTSFTSNERTKEWIKITGYFVNKEWRPSTKEMWIKSVNALKRDK